MPNAPGLPPIRPKHTPAPRLTTTERGYGWAHQVQRARLLVIYPLCQRCADGWSAELHHLDGDPFNRSPANVLMLCERCHQDEHG